MVSAKVIAAWWFWAWLGTSAGVVVGPFETQAQCEKIRSAMAINKTLRPAPSQPCMSDK